MGEISMELLRSDKAIVGQRQHRTDSGVGEIQYVILADGFMIDCGHDFRSVQRAAALATIINAAPTELRQALDKHTRFPTDGK
jgi:hypothetical protein